MSLEWPHTPTSLGQSQFVQVNECHFVLNSAPSHSIFELAWKGYALTTWTSVVTFMPCESGSLVSSALVRSTILVVT